MVIRSLPALGRGRRENRGRPLRVEGHALPDEAALALSETQLRAPYRWTASTPAEHSIDICVTRDCCFIAAGARLKGEIVETPDGCAVVGVVRPAGRAWTALIVGLLLLNALEGSVRVLQDLAEPFTSGPAVLFDIVVMGALVTACGACWRRLRPLPAEAAERLRAQVVLAVRPW